MSFSFRIIFRLTQSINMEFLPPIEVLLRLFIALLLGGMLGMERNIAHKTAGMRTYALVSLGAALFTLISIESARIYMGVANVDPLRIASQIVLGVGFLGGGLIIFRDGGFNNVTTAAGIWVAAGIGMAVGMGFYSLAITSTALTLFSFTLLWYFEQKIVRKVASRFEVSGHARNVDIVEKGQ